MYTGFWWGEQRCIQGFGGETRAKHRWEHNIKMDHQEVEWGPWTELIWLMIQTRGGSCNCGNEPSSFMKCGNFLTS